MNHETAFYQNLYSEFLMLNVKDISVFLGVMCTLKSSTQWNFYVGTIQEWYISFIIENMS